MYQIEEFFNQIMKAISKNQGLFITMIIILSIVFLGEFVALILYTKSNIKKDRHTGKIICGKCQSENLAFTEEIYKHVNPILRIPIYVFTILTVILYIVENFKFGTLFALFTIFSFCMIKLFETFRSRKSHTKAICKDCGEIWYLQ